MPAPRLILLLLALAFAVVCGPALVKLLALMLTGSALFAEIMLLTVLLVPSVKLLFVAELPEAPPPRLLPAPRLRLSSGGERRSGRVHAGSATLLRARDRSGTYLWRIQSEDLIVITDEGARLRVCGVMHIEGDFDPIRHAPELPLAAPGLERIRVGEGDELELRGPISREPSEAGYRESAEIEVMRGMAGAPIRITKIA